MGSPNCPLCWVEAHAGNPDKRLSSPLQIKALKRRFMDLNPGYATDLVDWKHVLDEKLTMAENVEVFREEYPQFDWGDERVEGPRVYEKQIVDEARAQVGEFSYDVVKSGKLKALEAGGRRAERLKFELEECQMAAPRRRLGPGVCKIKTVHVVAHKRCLPRIARASDA